jgi:pilus assembly protein FimV
MMAPGFDEGTSTLTGTEVLEGRLEGDESGSTSLVKSLRVKDSGSVDLDLADLTAALHGADTVEQPRASSFSRDVFGGGDTPLDLDIGSDSGGADDPTGTEEVGLDPQTMTEVGTKLDLARAYIDMGDPEGARSILEEVLDEGDSNQRREAQGLIDVLSA